MIMFVFYHHVTNMKYTYHPSQLLHITKKTHTRHTHTHTHTQNGLIVTPLTLSVRVSVRLPIVILI